MIDVLDNTLRQLFLSRIDEIKDESQVRFQPPDDTWRTAVANLTVNGQPVNALNVYLVDVRENRVLRSNERLRDFHNATVTETRAPRRMDCHYLISAWSPANMTPAIEPTLDEHALLYKTVAALMNSEPLVPRNIFSPNPLPAGFPAVIADAELPTTILPMEGFPKLAEFWGSPGTRHSWKPAVYLIVTLPVVLATDDAGPMVTTRFIEYELQEGTTPAEIDVEIGGTITNAGNPIPAAWVRIEDIAFNPIAVTTANEIGRFIFSGLKPGTYVLRVRSQGFSETTRKVDVPSANGNYDVQLP